MPSGMEGYCGRQVICDALRCDALRLHKLKTLRRAPHPYPDPDCGSAPRVEFGLVRLPRSSYRAIRDSRFDLDISRGSGAVSGIQESRIREFRSPGVRESGVHEVTVGRLDGWAYADETQASWFADSDETGYM